MTSLQLALAPYSTWVQKPNGDNPFNLACRIDPGASAEEIRLAWPRGEVDKDLSDLWTATREAWLFVDVEYGQWGLHLLTAKACADQTAAQRAQRPDDFAADDIVFGEFLGDSELLVCASRELDDRRYLIALPLDPRSDWPAAGSSVSAVLDRYLASEGEKYWESG